MLASVILWDEKGLNQAQADNISKDSGDDKTVYLSNTVMDSMWYFR